MKYVKPSKSHTVTGITDLLMTLASRPEGVSCAEIMPTYTLKQIQNNSCGPLHSGRLLSVGYGALRRYFVDPACAQVYAAAVLVLRAERRQRKAQAQAKRESERRKQARALKPAKVAKLAKVAPVTIKSRSVKFADQPAIVPPHVKVQECPSPPHFGPAARLANAKPAIAVALKAGADL